jgi:hypothetical protein
MVEDAGYEPFQEHDGLGVKLGGTSVFTFIANMIGTVERMSSPATALMVIQCALGIIDVRYGDTVVFVGQPFIK